LAIAALIGLLRREKKDRGGQTLSRKNRRRFERSRGRRGNPGKRAQYHFIQIRLRGRFADPGRRGGVDITEIRWRGLK